MASGLHHQAYRAFPGFSAWIRELRPGDSPEDAQRDTAAKLTAILARVLRECGSREEADVTDCFHDLLLFMEQKLGAPMEFAVDKVRYSPAGRFQDGTLEVKLMHLLHARPFRILLCHPNLRPAERFRAQLRDMASGSEVTRLTNLSCEDDRRVPIRLAYATLGHEQDALVELSQDNDGNLAYYAGVRAVRHESFEIRMGFVVASARNFALEHARSKRKWRASSIEELPAAEMPARGDEARQHVALILARRAILRLPVGLRNQLIAHYVDGASWAQIASLYGVSEAKAKKDVSRVLQNLSEAIVAAEPEAKPGAVHRVVSWLKEMLPYILGRP